MINYLISLLTVNLILQIVQLLFRSVSFNFVDFLILDALKVIHFEYLQSKSKIPQNLPKLEHWV